MFLYLRKTFAWVAKNDFFIILQILKENKK